MQNLVAMTNDGLDIKNVIVSRATREIVVSNAIRSTTESRFSWTARVVSARATAALT
jgi:hypothetical protein